MDVSNVDTILKQIDELIAQHAGVRSRSKYSDLSDLDDSFVTEVVTRLMAGVQRFAPQGSAHRDGAEKLLSQYHVNNGYVVDPLLGVLRALRANYAAAQETTESGLANCVKSSLDGAPFTRSSLQLTSPCEFPLILPTKILRRFKGGERKSRKA